MTYFWSFLEFFINNIPPTCPLRIKTNFSKACTRYLANNPGSVVTTDKLALLVVEAWPFEYTALNIMAGFKKMWNFPINPSEVTNQQTMQSKAVTVSC